MRAFVTGSRKYGIPNQDSDVDLVVLVTDFDLDILRVMADRTLKVEEKDQNYDGIGGMAASLRFGRLNLICVTDPMAYEVWRRGSVELDRVRPVEREMAVQYFQELRDHFGLNGREPDVENFK